MSAHPANDYLLFSSQLRLHPQDLRPKEHSDEKPRADGTELPLGPQGTGRPVRRVCRIGKCLLKASSMRAREETDQETARRTYSMCTRAVYVVVMAQVAFNERAGTSSPACSIHEVIMVRSEAGYGANATKNEQ